MCTHGGMEGDIREKEQDSRKRAVRRQVIGILRRVMNWWNVSMETKKGKKNSIILPTLTYGIRNMDNEGRTAVKNMYSVDELCKENVWSVKMDDESNENVY